MSDANNFSGTGQGRPRFEDRTTGPGNRDPWNNRVQQDDGGGASHRAAGGDGNGDNKDNKDNKNKGTEIDDEMIDNIWNKHVDQNNDGNNNNQNNNNNNQNNNNNNNNQNPERPDPKAQMDNYLKGVGLDPIVIDDAQKAKMAEGDFTDFVNTVNQKLVNAHVKALSGSETMIQAAVEKAVNKTKTDMQSSRRGEQIRDALHEAMPWTKKPSISPVAQSVAQRFIDRGMSDEDAIKGTKAYFDSMNNAMNNDGINKNRNANFSSGHNKGPQSDIPEGGWLAVLTGNGRS